MSQRVKLLLNLISWVKNEGAVRRRYNASSFRDTRGVYYLNPVSSHGVSFWLHDKPTEENNASENRTKQ